MPTTNLDSPRTLIVGAGALGGLIAARMLAAGLPVALATRDEASAAQLRTRGIHVTGVGGDAHVMPTDVRTVVEHVGPYDVIVLATKAHAAMELSPSLCRMLGPDGVLVPIQNGAVPTLLAEQLGACVVPALSNLGATLTAPGEIVQRNAGHLLLADGESGRRIRAVLGGSVDVRLAADFQGAVWSKLLLNCSTTTLGAVAGRTMREYVALPEGRALFDRVYDEALAVARASGVRPARMLVEAEPPAAAPERDRWLANVLASYGDLKPSMLQDLERGRPTEIDFINGYVVERGRALGVAVRANDVVTFAIKAIGRGTLRPDPSLLRSILGAWSSIGTRSDSSSPSLAP